MALLALSYRRLVDLLAVIAGAMLVWQMLAIITSVLFRNAGLQPPAWLFTSSEYAMLYLTMLGAPWLVREKGHVHIELLTSAMPPHFLNVFSRFVALLCVLICTILAWKGFDLVVQNIERRDLDVRAYFFPKWILTIAFPISFGLMAVEFARFVVGRDIMHTGQAGIHE